MRYLLFISRFLLEQSSSDNTCVLRPTCRYCEIFYNDTYDFTVSFVCSPIMGSKTVVSVLVDNNCVLLDCSFSKCCIKTPFFTHQLIVFNFAYYNHFVLLEIPLIFCQHLDILILSVNVSLLNCYDIAVVISNFNFSFI